MDDKTSTIRDFILEDIPNFIDRLRIFPRAFISIYMYIVLHSFWWIITLPDPSGAQAAIFGTIISVGTAWFGLYVASGRKQPFRIKTDASGSVEIGSE